MRPFQHISFSHEDSETQFSLEDDPQLKIQALKSCSVMNARVKFADNVKDIELPWLNGSYVNLTVNNKTLLLKVRKSLFLYNFNKGKVM